MNELSQEARERIIDAAEKVPQFPDGLAALASVKEQDLEKIVHFFLTAPEPSTVETHKFLSDLLSYLPKGDYYSPWLAAQSILLLARRESEEATIVLETLMDRFSPNQDTTRLVRFIEKFKPIQAHLDSTMKRAFYAGRNSKSLAVVVTACDLRAVFQEDFSVASAPDSYNPFIDLEGFTPVASVRLFFESTPDYYDFSCDLNGVKLILHSLEMTKKQLEMLQKIADNLEKEGTNEQPPC